MMHLNWLAILVAALVPLMVGFIWYHPKVFGTAWMKASNTTEEKIKAGNMVVIFLISFVFSLMLAFEMQFLVIHQYHYMSILVDEEGFNDPNSSMAKMVADFYADYGNNFRTFKHGMLHGFMASLFIVLPVLGTNALFERKSWKYIWLNVGFWTVCFMLMGGIVSAWQ